MVGQPDLRERQFFDRSRRAIHFRMSNGFKQPLSAALTMLALAAGAAPSVSAAPPATSVPMPTGKTTCEFSGWIPGMTASKPLGVRAAPSAKARILGPIPVGGDPKVYEYAAEVRITGTSPGWIRINQASDDMNLNNDAPARQIYRGVGWIPNDAAAIGIQSGLGFERPDPSSRKILDHPGRWLTELGRIEAILGCSGEWILLQYRLDKRPVSEDRTAEIAPRDRRSQRAWFRGVCSAQETTCDMASVDATAPTR